MYIAQNGPVRMRDVEHAFVVTKKLSRPTLYRYRTQLVAQGKLQVHAVPGHPPYNTYSVPKHHQAAINALQRVQNATPLLGKWLDEIPWEDGPRDVYVTDVKQKVLWTNDDTGATLILLKSPADPRPAGHRHLHPDANQWSFGFAGEAIEAGVPWTFYGSTGYIPKGTPHGPAITTKDTLCLVFWDGPRTYIIIENDDADI
jgi:hypothetical protein